MLLYFIAIVCYEGLQGNHQNPICLRYSGVKMYTINNFEEKKLLTGARLIIKKRDKPQIISAMKEGHHNISCRLRDYKQVYIND